ncbi:transcription factor protein isoform X1 [Ciona intestinalis]
MEVNCGSLIWKPYGSITNYLRPSGQPAMQPAPYFYSWLLLRPNNTKVKSSLGESTRPCTLSGDDSFYCSGESTNSTSSPTSSITSSRSCGPDSDEGFPRQDDLALRNKASKNLQHSVELFCPIKSKPIDHDSDLMPMDLSCKKRTSPKQNCKTASVAKTSPTIKSEPIDDYPASLPHLAPSSSMPSVSPPSSNITPEFPPSMFPSWPYFSTPITSSVGGFPSFPSSYIAGKYLHPALFLPPPATSCRTVPTNSPLGFSVGNSMLPGLHQLAASHFQPSMIKAVAQPQAVPQRQNSPNHDDQKFAQGSPQPRFSPTNLVQDPSLLAEFARVFSRQVEQFRPKPSFEENNTKNQNSERRRKNAKPLKISADVSPPHPQLNDMRSISFKDLPTMVSQTHDHNAFYGAQKNRQELKRKSSSEDNSESPTGKKVCLDSKTTWRQIDAPTFQISDAIEEQNKAPQPVSFKPCRIPCTECGRTYATIGALAKHAKTHEDPESGNKFNCKICKKECSSLGALRMHIRTHTLPCECHICGKAFSRTWLLQGHIRTHTGEKPYQCTVCSRAFADRSNLRAHMQTHETVKRYSCVTCEKTFSRISLLKRHQVHCETASQVEQRKTAS